MYYSVYGRLTQNYNAFSLELAWPCGLTKKAWEAMQEMFGVQLEVIHFGVERPAVFLEPWSLDAKRVQECAESTWQGLSGGEGMKMQEIVNNCTSNNML